ncbi:hypothetical protein Dimus_029116 [Dionaea muscipula]
MHIDSCKEFYANLTLYHYKKKEVAQSRVRGVEIEFNSMRLALILDIPGNNGFYEYIKEVWGESGSDDQFYDTQVEVKVEEPAAEAQVIPVFPASPGDSTNVQKEPATARVDPTAPTGSISESVMIKLQAEFERVRANRIQADFEKAQAENTRLLALLQQAQSKPKP